MPHSFDTGLSAPLRTLIRSGTVNLLAGLRSPAGYLRAVIPWAGVVRSWVDAEGIDHLFEELAGRAPAIAVAVGDCSSRPQGVGGFNHTEELELLVYHASNHMGGRTIGRAAADVVALASTTADPGLDIMLAHAKELIVGQRCGIDHPAMKQCRPDREEELTSRDSITIYLQTYRITTSLSINPNRGVTQLLTSIAWRTTQEATEVELPAAATRPTTIDTTLQVQVGVTGPAVNVAPVASFTHVVTSLSVAFTDTSTDYDGTIASWSWTFGDGGVSTLRNPTRSYAAPGTYSVQLTVTDSLGATQSATNSVIAVAAVAPNVAPTANFTHVVNDLGVTFTDTSTDSNGTIASWAWNFGDGTVSTLQNPTRVYTSAGTYFVQLTVTDNLGATHAVTRTVTAVANVAPVASFTHVVNILDVAFTSTSTDSDGAIASYSWAFGDATTSTLQNPLHTYAAAGTYSVMLTVTDNDGATHSATNNVIPVAPAGTMKIAAFLGQSNAAGQEDTDNLSVANQTTYVPAFPAIQLAAFRATNDATPVTTYDVLQSLGPITSQATNNMGLELSMGRKLDAHASGQFAIAKYGVGATGLNTHWKKTATYPATGGNLFTRAMAKLHAQELTLAGTIRCVVWVQGENDAGIAADAAAYETNLTQFISDVRLEWPAVPFVIVKLHTENTGTEKATVRTAQVNVAAAVTGVTLVDVDSLSGLANYNTPHFTANGYISAGDLVGIGVLRAMGINIPPVASFTSIATGTTVAFTDTSTDPIGTIVGWAWTFGDGASSTLQNPSRTYAADGTYAVQLTVTDSNGATNSTTANVTVTGAPAPVYVAQGTWTVVASAGTIAPPWPVGHVAGQRAHLVIESDGTPPTLLTANGFTLVRQQVATGTTLTVFEAVANSATMAANGGVMPAPVIADGAADDHRGAQILTFSASTTDVVTGDSDSVGSTSVSVPGHTTTGGGRLVVAYASHGTDLGGGARFTGWANADLADVLERSDQSTIQGNGGGFGCATGVKAAVGAFGATTATLLTSSVQARIVIALKA